MSKTPSEATRHRLSGTKYSHYHLQCVTRRWNFKVAATRVKDFAAVPPATHPLGRPSSQRRGRLATRTRPKAKNLSTHRLDPGRTNPMTVYG